jgi:ferredoxin-NADP reductase
VVLEWGLPDGQTTYWTDRLAALAAAHGRFGWSLVRGGDWVAVHEALAARAVEHARARQAPVFYTVGNGDMCRRVRDALVAAGVDRRKQIRNEIFYPVMEGQK